MANQSVAEPILSHPTKRHKRILKDRKALRVLLFRELEYMYIRIIYTYNYKYTPFGVFWYT